MACFYGILAEFIKCMAKIDSQAKCQRSFPAQLSPTHPSIHPSLLAVFWASASVSLCRRRRDEWLPDLKFLLNADLLVLCVSPIPTHKYDRSDFNKAFSFLWPAKEPNRKWQWGSKPKSSFCEVSKSCFLLLIHLASPLFSRLSFCTQIGLVSFPQITALRLSFHFYMPICSLLPTLSAPPPSHLYILPSASLSVHVAQYWKRFYDPFFWTKLANLPQRCFS